MDPHRELESLARDQRSGASELTRRALPLLATVAQESDGDRTRAVLEAAQPLLQAHPAMAPLLWLVHDCLEGLDEEGTACFERLHRTQQERRAALVEQATDHLPEEGTVATYSRSGTVLDALERAASEGAQPTVLVSEARPAGEGVDVARQLAQASLDVRLTYDAALPALVDAADLVLVGADALCADGLVNKAGTGPLLQAAGRAGATRLVLAGTDKLLPADHAHRPPLTTQGRLDDLDLPAGVTVQAPLFTVTPLDHVDGILTEDGMLSPDEVDQRIQEVTLHPRVPAPP